MRDMYCSPTAAAGTERRLCWSEVRSAAFECRAAASKSMGSGGQEHGQRVDTVMEATGRARARGSVVRSA